MIVDGAYAAAETVGRERIERAVSTLEDAEALGVELAARLQASDSSRAAAPGAQR
jgi:hypothetical protein